VSQVVEKFTKYKVQPKNLMLDRVDIVSTTLLRQYALQSKNHIITPVLKMVGLTESRLNHTC